MTAKQQKFIEAYEGNGVDAARKAGYSGDDQTLRAIAYENLTKPHIFAAIKKRQQSEMVTLIAPRLARQAFWTSVMNNESIELRDRLKASELLAKSEGDFMKAVVVDQNSDVDLSERLRDARLRVIQINLDERVKQLRESAETNRRS